MRAAYLFALIYSAFISIETLEAQSLHETRELKKEVEALSRSVAELAALVKLQQKTIDELKAGAKPAAYSPPGSAQPPPVPVSATGITPEIGVVGDILGTLSESSEDHEGNDRFSVRHVELIIGHDVDPYSRFDATIAFSDEEDVELEEAYLSHWGIPGDFKAHLGRIRPNVGIASKLHRDSLETVDEPLVVSRLFGLEGLSRTGVEISNFLPVPWKNPAHEITFGILEGGVGHDGTLFGDTRRRPTYYSRLRHSFDISEASLFNLGNSFLLGSSDDDSSNEVRAFGLDAAFVHRFNAVNRFKLQSELYLQDRSAGLSAGSEDEHEHEEDEEEHEDPSHADDLAPADFRDNPLGLYALADYRLAERWSVGGRYDYVEPVELAEGVESHESAYSAYLTFHQSEFARWRFQYQHADELDGGSDDRFYLQATVAIGTHKHQIQ